MVTRVIAGVVIAVLLLAAALSGMPVVHYPLILLIALVSGYECFRLLHQAGLPNYKWLGLTCGAVWLISIPIFPYNLETLMLFFGGVVLLVLLRQIFHGPEDAAKRMAGTLLGFFYVFFLMGFAFLLFNGGFPNGGTRLVEALTGNMIVHNYMLVIYALIVTKVSDAGAYFVGSFFGKHKMAPKLSPGKTWEGTVGGILAAVAAAFLFAQFALKKPYLFHSYQFTPTQIAISAVVIAVIGVFGDLAESLLKRSAGVKDSGQLAPGIGGALDMVDSPLFTFPVMFFFLELWHH